MGSKIANSPRSSKDTSESNTHVKSTFDTAEALVSEMEVKR